jgi:hypothetical protein
VTKTVETKVKLVRPTINILKYKPKLSAAKPETQVVLLGDLHLGEETETFNPAIAYKRLDNLFQSSLRIAELHRHIYPINDIVLMLLGDMVHGENPYQGAKVGTIQMGAIDQVYDLALPKLASLIASYRENFATVTVYCVVGNHGRVSKEAPETSNWDNALYKALASIKFPSGVKIVIPHDFYQMAIINEHKFFIYHGDAIKATNGIPYFAQQRKIMSWHMTYGGFDYSICGHWHKDDFFRIGSSVKHITNGSLVSDDPYALKVIGTSTIPTQASFGVTENRGITWYYALSLDKEESHHHLGEPKMKAII